MALLHAENQELVNYFTHKYRDELHRHDLQAWGEARNLSVVLTSALEMIALARQFGVKLHLLHLSTSEDSPPSNLVVRLVLMSPVKLPVTS